MHDLARLLPHGVAPRHELTLATSASSVSRWTTDGDLIHIHPGVVMLRSHANDLSALARAATLWGRGPLSHFSALAAWGLIAAHVDPVHVTVPADRFPRGSAGVVAHRTTLPLPVTHIDGVRVVHLTRSLVDAWSWAHSDRRNPAAARERPLARQAVIDAVRGRGTSVTALRAESARLKIHSGRREIAALLDLVVGGCESELEIWGVTQVRPGPPSVPAAVQQYPIQLSDGRSIRADAAYVQARVIVELDGAAFHGSKAARERDLRRDSALAALGWVVIRFSFARLTSDPEGCRREIETVVLGRLAQR
ncbi:MAG: DUF559 domain-containing protein [Kineosporiaceae bacterium]